MGTGAGGSTDRLLYRKSGARGLCTESSGRGADGRRYLCQIHGDFSVRGRILIRSTGDDPRADGDPDSMVFDPGLRCGDRTILFVPKIFTAIAFDSGGVASGPMTATFLLPLAQGACVAVGGNLVADAFGVVAMVAMTPLITIQILGMVYQLKQQKSGAGVFAGAADAFGALDENAIIEL